MSQNWLHSSWVHGLKYCKEETKMTETESCTPRECMDWNISAANVRICLICCTPRECMDWNGYFSSKKAMNDQLHSSWVHGLKSQSLKLTWKTHGVALLVSAWIEIRKSVYTITVEQLHSSWVHGLKSPKLERKDNQLLVALLVSAWIEMSRPE